MTQRLGYGYQYNIQREKASKMAQIESYVGILIENNKNYADELNLLRKENTDLRGQIELMMGEMLRNKESFEDSLNQTKTSYAQEIGTLIEELKDILNKKEQMEGSYKSLLQQLSYQSEFDKANRAVQLGELERNYENKIRILNQRIMEQNKQLETNFYLSSDCKGKMMKEIDALRFEIGQQRKLNNDLGQGQVYLEGQVGRLSAALKAISKEKEDMGVNLLKMEQEKNHAIIQLRQASALLRQQLNDQLDNIKHMEVALVAKEKQYQNLAQRCQHQERQKCQYEDLYHKTALQLGQRDGQLSALKVQFTRFSDSSNKEVKKLTDLLRVMEGENNRFLQEKQELSAQNMEKQQEIYTLLERVQKVERQYEITSNQLRKVEEENIELARSNDLLKQELEISVLEQRKASQRCQLQANHLETLQKLLQKEKRRAAHIEYSSSDREAALSKQMSLQNQISQRYELELQALMREKSEMVSVFEAEKERLVRNYENALREKELLFKDKIHFLENEVLELSKCA